MGKILRFFEPAVSSSVRNNVQNNYFSLKKRQQSRNVWGFFPFFISSAETLILILRREYLDLHALHSFNAIFRLKLQAMFTKSPSLGSDIAIITY